MPSHASGRKKQIIRQLDEKFETDRFGVDTVSLKIEIPDAIFPRELIRYNQSHPRFASTLLTKRSGQRVTPGFWSVTYTFEGYLFEAPEPVYELTGGLDQEPIESHPNFISTIAGTPSAPLNGAVFIAPSTGLPTEDDEQGVFREFRANIGGGLNPKAGIESYLVPGAEWKMVEFTATKPTELRNLGTIDAPTGGNPNLSGRNWLLWSQTYTKRGFIYQVTTTWKLSGRNGWDTEIYGGS